MTDSESQILNLRSADPFGDVSAGLGSLNDDKKKKNEDNLGQGLIHIRIQVTTNNF